MGQRLNAHGMSLIARGAECGFPHDQVMRVAVPGLPGRPDGYLFLLAGAARGPFQARDARCAEMVSVHLSALLERVTLNARSELRVA